MTSLDREWVSRPSQVKTLEKPLKPDNLRLQLPSDVGVEIVGVYLAVVFHAVVEPGIEQFDAEFRINSKMW